MYCVSCGKALEPGTKFCPSCGAVVDAAAASPRAASMPPPPPPGGGYARPVRSQQLVRPREGRVIAGVCAAFALQYGWDVVLVRILLGVVTLVTGIALGVIAYLVAWVVIPDAPFALSSSSR